MMYFDIGIFEDGTVDALFELSRKFPNSRTNDQGISNVWAQNRGIWTKLPTEKAKGRFLYDLHERPGCVPEDYLMLKYPGISRKDFAWGLSERIFGWIRNWEKRRLDSLAPW
jgi:hypothetical protein